MTIHDPTLFQRAGIIELTRYLEGTRNRHATLGGSWPVDLGPIAAPKELQQASLAPLPYLKRCGGEITEKQAAHFNARNPFPSLCEQFRAVAAELGDFVEPPIFPDDLFWCNSVVQPTQPQFIGWHFDGDILVEQDGQTIRQEPEDGIFTIGRNKEFRPQQIYLQASLVLPTLFANQITEEFPRNLFVATRDGRSNKLTIDGSRMHEWAEEHAALTPAPAGRIIAFPAGLPHTGIAATVPTPRTLVVCRLELR